MVGRGHSETPAMSVSLKLVFSPPPTSLGTSSCHTRARSVLSVLSTCIFDQPKLIVVNSLGKGRMANILKVPAPENCPDFVLGGRGS